MGLEGEFEVRIRRDAQVLAKERPELAKALINANGSGGSGAKLEVVVPKPVFEVLAFLASRDPAVARPSANARAKYAVNYYVECLVEEVIELLEDKGQ